MAGHQQNDYRPWDGPPTVTSPNLHVHDKYFPRPSLKHRSSTMTSIASSYKSPSSLLTSSTPTLSTTPREGGTPLASPFERPESVARNILSRGSRILKRQGSRFNLSPSLSPDAEEGWGRPVKTSEVSEVFHRVPKIRSKSAHGKRDALKSSISEPFDFHHVTHTHPAHFKALERVSNNELVTEFTAIRAAQRPKNELKGIHAACLHNKKSSIDRETHTDRPVTSSGIAGEPVTPPRMAQSRRSKTPPNVGVLRQSRSIENFSRPIPKSPTSPIMPPTRRSSRNACPMPLVPEPSTAVVDAMLGINANPKSILEQDGDEPDSDRGYTPERIDMAAVGNAVTTLDNGIKLLRSISYANQMSELDNVPEEEESAPLDFSQTPSSKRTTISSLRHSKSFPSSRPSHESTAPTSLSPSQTFDSLNRSESDPEMIASVPHSESRRFSIGFNEIDINGWEDDIDYCYEHAAEADCDFDWTQKSAQEDDQTYHQRQMMELEAAQQRQLRQQQAVANLLQVSPGPPGFPPSRRQTQVVERSLVVPDLDPPSAKSASSMPEALTPKNSTEGATPFEIIESAEVTDQFDASDEGYFAKHYDSHPNEEAMYEDMLSGQPGQHDYTYYPNRHSQVSPISSRRSSQAPISKCNSQESMFPSRTASLMQKHRSSNSSADLPELIHSLSSSRENINAEPVDLTDPNAVPLYRSLSHKRARSLAGSNLKKVASNHSFFEPETPNQLGVLEEVSPIAEEINPMRSHFDLSSNHGPTFANRMRSASNAIKLGGKPPRATSYFPPSSSTATGPTRI